MKQMRSIPKKNQAQAMVEFALALPILLMLLYGLLEAGRLLFTYASVVTATRQAARYGSTTGIGVNGVARYLDCKGMRDAAQNTDFFNVFADSDITIWYDDGPSKNILGTCTGNASSISLTGNTNRVVVEIDAHFVALVPKLVPFVSQTVTAESARTIILSIAVPGGSGSGGSTTKEPTATTITSDTPDPSYVTQNVTVTVTVTGGSTTPTGTVAITGTDSDCTITLSGGTGSCTVSFTSAGAKTITATYQGDSTHSSSLDTETHTVVLAPTTTLITLDAPDPSTPNGAVNVVVSVSSVYGIPNGTVNITGANTNCNITLSSGTGNCSVVFTSIGSKTITATYNGNSIYLSSVDTEPHNVANATPGPSPTPTKTNTPTPTPVPNSCDITYVVNQWDSGFTASVTITNNGATAINGYTLSWLFTAGQQVTSGWNATFSQSGSTVNASNPAGNWNGTIAANGGTVNFGFQGTHSGTNPTPAGFTLNGLPCTGGSPAPTATPTPSLTPSPIPTSVPCNQVTHGSLTISNGNNTMSMTINNPIGIPLTVQNVMVTWNHDKGRSGGSGGRALNLTGASLGSSFWSGSVNSASYTITPTSLSIPTGSSTIIFTFQYNYANQDGTERILINLSTPGCEFYPIDSNVISNP